MGKICLSVRVSTLYMPFTPAVFKFLPSNIEVASKQHQGGHLFQTTTQLYVTLYAHHLQPKCNRVNSVETTSMPSLTNMFDLDQNFHDHDQCVF